MCFIHGGNAAHVKAAAGARMLDLQPAALDNIKMLLAPVPVDPIPCPFCRRGMPRDENLLAKVSIAVLDRTGLGPTAKLEIEHKNDDAWIDFCTVSEAEQLYTVMTAARERMGDITDVEIVNDTELLMDGEEIIN